jgi:hypothetical protein
LTTAASAVPVAIAVKEGDGLTDTTTAVDGRAIAGLVGNVVDAGLHPLTTMATTRGARTRIGTRRTKRMTGLLQA